LVIARGSTLSLVAVIALLLSHGTSAAADLLKLAIGQRGLWDSAIAEIGVGAGIFQKHNLELQTVYTSGGGETQQAVISGSVDIGVSPGMLGVLGAYAKGAGARDRRRSDRHRRILFREDELAAKSTTASCSRTAT
jgi:NitT/TauT family transport system substrate-binding protein